MIPTNRKYVLEASDSFMWILVQDKKTKLKVDVQLQILDFRHECRPQKIFYYGLEKYLPCSYLCCALGCYVSPLEIDQIKQELELIKEHLSSDALVTLDEYNDQFWDPDDSDEEEDLMKIRCTPEEWGELPDDFEEFEELKSELNGKPRRCLFLTEEGKCAIHIHLENTGKPWHQFKCNICTTFPLDIRPLDKTIGFMLEPDEYMLQPLDCFCGFETRKKRKEMPQIIEVYRDIISNRFSPSFWDALNEFAEDFRNGIITFDDLHKFPLKKK